MRMKISTSFTTFVVVLGVLIAPQADASQKFTYTLNAPFRYSYEEKGTFKPPAKLSQQDIKFVLTNNCDVIVGKKPVVDVRAASGKIVTSVNMRPVHKLTSSKWGKDENGENKFLVQGVCIFVGDIPKKLPDSNFYQFFVSTGDSYQSRWSYPYTLRQLSALKSGIKETRFLDDLRTPGAITPIPDLETPQVKPLVCSEGKLLDPNSSGEAGDGETVQIAYFMVVNGIYRPTRKESSSPSVDHIGERVQGNSDFFVQFEGLTSIELISENTPAFVTWRRPGDKNFSTNLRISYSTYAAGEIWKMAKEKTYEIQISSDCKSASVTTP